MSLNKICLILLAGILLFSFIGCNGPAPGTNPSIQTMTANDSASPGDIEAGSTIILKVTLDNVDNEINRVVSTTWKAVNRLDGTSLGSFLWTSSGSLSNAWIAPQTVDEPIPVDISVSLKTLQGGSASTVLHLTLVPKGNLPQFEFDYDAMGMGIDPVTGLLNSNKKTGQRFQIRGSVMVNGIEVDTTQPNVSIFWSDTSGDLGFSSLTVAEPWWTPPTLENDSNGFPVPETHYLKVETSVNGYSSTNYLVVNVVP